MGMDEIFIIQELWIDGSENTIDLALGWETVGFVESEDLAKRIVQDAGIEPARPWPNPKPVPKKRYFRVGRIDG